MASLFVYVIESGGAYKIGVSTDPEKRLAQLKTGFPRGGSIVATVAAAPLLERGLHRHFADKQLSGEWFSLTAEDVEWVKNLSGDEIRNLVAGLFSYAEPTGRDLVPGFAAMIAKAREAAEWSMAELARQSGLSVNTVSAIEREIRAPSLRVASALVVALKLKVWLDAPSKPVRPHS
jgi:DNA-binding XRE family transcriptional regulator